MAFGRARKARAALAAALETGTAVTLECSGRRTSPRGWGPWTPLVVHVGATAADGAWWHADDPLAMGFAPGRGPVDVAFSAVTAVWVRPVRFQAEAFHGMDGEIVVVEGERSTVELAVPAELVAPLAARLAVVLGAEAR